MQLSKLTKSETERKLALQHIRLAAGQLGSNHSTPHIRIWLCHRYTPRVPEIRWSYEPARMSAHMSQKICAVVRQPDRNATAATDMGLSPRSAEMATRSATARLEQRRAELNKLQTTSREFKAARSVVFRGTGTDKLWYTSGQYWGKAYTIGSSSTRGCR